MATVYAAKSNVYIPRKHKAGTMGDIALIEVPHQPTCLESFAERLAADREISLSVAENGLHPADLKYYFKKEGSNGNIYISYLLTCHSDVGSKIMAEAIVKFNELMCVKDFDERIFFKKNNNCISVIGNKRNPVGEYSVVQGNSHCGSYTLDTIEVAFFI